MIYLMPSKILTAVLFKRIFFFAGGSLLLAAQILAAMDAPEYMQPGTLAYQLATNTAARAEGRTGEASDMQEFHAFMSIEVNRFLLPVWSHDFWLKDVQGLNATPIGFSNDPNGQGLCTMVSPRHYLFATHMHPDA